MRKRKLSSDRAFNTLLLIIVTTFLLLVLYPLIYIVSCSFSSGTAVTTGRVLLWPVDFSLVGYEIVFSHKAVWTGYANTIFYTVVGTILNLFLKFSFGSTESWLRHTECLVVACKFLVVACAI